MPTFVGKENNKVVSVVVAKDLMCALLYWSKNDIHIDDNDVWNTEDLDGIDVVIPLVTTERKMIMNASCTDEQEYFVIV